MSPTFGHTYSLLCSCGECRGFDGRAAEDALPKYAPRKLYYPRPGRTYQPRPLRSTPQEDFAPEAEG